MNSILLCLATASALSTSSLPMQKLQYPQTARGTVVETLHGVPVADPYRWLEDANSEETKAWVQAQNAVTFGYLRNIPERGKIVDLVTKLINYEKFSSPNKVGKHYFYSKNDGLQNQAVIYVTESLDKEGRILLDPNKLSTDGTIALGSTSVSSDGKLMAYSLSKGGSDWLEWQVMDVDTGKVLSDVVKWSKNSNASWSKDNKGFYYSAYDAPKPGEELSGINYFHKVYYHKIGTPQSQDELVFERKDQKEWGFAAIPTEDGRYLVIINWKGTNREIQVFVKDLRKKSNPFQEIRTGFDASYSYLGNDGEKFYFQTDRDAPNSRIVAIVLSAPQPLNWQTIVPEGKEPIQSASLLGKTLFVNKLKDAYTRIERYSLDGKELGSIELPGIGTAEGFGGLRNEKETFYTYASFTSPTTIYRLDLKSNKSEVWKQPKLTFDPAKYEVTQVFYPSKDGTKIPMFLAHKKGLVLDGNNPTLLYGYGGFAVPMTPYYSTRFMTWMEMGGVAAIACLRGGTEYGNAWHDAGRLKNKQNVFDDFIAGAEYLIREKYTSTSKLAINGGSNGGLLVGAVLNQRPDLFGAAIPEVGVMDMLRFHKFTVGWAWTSDYGSPDVKDDFDVLMKYSPLHNVKPGAKYPPTLVITGDHDDRVVPAHSFKYAAALQHAQIGDAPTLIRIETSAGHGAGKPISKIIEEIADQWAFLTKSLEIKF